MVAAVRTVKNHRGLTLIEVLIASAILAVGLLALLSAFPIGYVDVNVSGGQSKATAYAQQMLEQLKNIPFVELLEAGGPFDEENPRVRTPEPGYTRDWTIEVVGSTPAPNRLVRIEVTVDWTRGDRPQRVTLETMRAE